MQTFCCFDKILSLETSEVTRSSDKIAELPTLAEAELHPHQGVFLTEQCWLQTVIFSHS